MAFLEFGAHNVTRYGAKGNASYLTGGGADDTTAIQAAYTAAGAAGGTSLVEIPGGRTYRITSTINVPQGVCTKGLGGRDGSAQSTPPTIVWDGANAGVAFQVSVATANIFTTAFENFTILSGASITNKLTNAIKFTTTGGATGSIDSGTIFRDMWFQTINGNAVYFNCNGSTNFDMTGGRFDNIYGGYGIYADLSGSGKAFIGHFESLTYVGGSTGQGKGFIHMDGEGASSGSGLSFITIDHLHSECNQDLTETFAAGAQPYDKRGIIRLGVTSSLPHIQHRISVAGFHHSAANPIASHSIFQITASTGTAAAASECAFIAVRNGNQLSASDGSDAGSTNEIRYVGGLLPSLQMYPWSGNYRNGDFVWGWGKDSTGETPGNFVNIRTGRYRVHGLSIHPDSGTVAPTITSGTGAPSDDEPIGSLYTRTTAGQPTFYSKTAAGSGTGNWTAK